MSVSGGPHGYRTCGPQQHRGDQPSVVGQLVLTRAFGRVEESYVGVMADVWDGVERSPGSVAVLLTRELHEGHTVLRQAQPPQNATGIIVTLRLVSL